RNHHLAGQLPLHFERELVRERDIPRRVVEAEALADERRQPKRAADGPQNPRWERIDQRVLRNAGADRRDHVGALAEAGRAAGVVERLPVDQAVAAAEHGLAVKRVREADPWTEVGPVPVVDATIDATCAGEE